MNALSRVSFEFILVSPSCWHLEQVLHPTWRIPALASRVARGVQSHQARSWGLQEAISPSSPNSTHRSRGCKEKTPTRDAKKNPSNQQFGSCGCQGDGEGCVWCCLLLGRDPASTPRGAFSWCHRGGEGPGRGNRSPQITSPPPLSPLSSEQRAWTRQWADGQ